MAFVLLRGDPTYLGRMTSRGGAPDGHPAPISRPARALVAARLSVALLRVVALLVAGCRAGSDAAGDQRLPMIGGYALFIVSSAIAACAGPVFPACLASAWFAIFLVGIAFSESISDFFKDRGLFGP